MNGDFKDTFEQVSKLHEIPVSVYEEINILSGASDKFIDEVIKLENMTDLQARADEALRYIKENGGIVAIPYAVLGKGLADTDSLPLTVWRQLYLLERSIKPRNSRWTWVARLKLFYNTYLEEHALLGTKYKDSKLYFLDKSGDHENLHAGRGKYGSDFYYFDDSIDGSNWQKMVKVEMKYCYNDLDSEIAKYNPTNKNHTYEANHVVLYKEHDGYYMIDYTKVPPIVEKLDTKEPTGLFRISL